MGAYRGAKKHGWLDEVYEIIEKNKEKKENNQKLR
jgi:hypothetical protein